MAISNYRVLSSYSISTRNNAPPFFKTSSYVPIKTSHRFSQWKCCWCSYEHMAIHICFAERSERGWMAVTFLSQAWGLLVPLHLWAAIVRRSSLTSLIMPGKPDPWRHPGLVYECKISNFNNVLPHITNSSVITKLSPHALVPVPPPYLIIGRGFSFFSFYFSYFYLDWLAFVVIILCHLFVVVGVLIRISPALLAVWLLSSPQCPTHALVHWISKHGPILSTRELESKPGPAVSFPSWRSFLHHAHLIIRGRRYRPQIGASTALGMTSPHMSWQ